jgi:hypothetical protein
MAAAEWNENVAENAVLADVERNGEVLLLADGRRLKVVRPDDATAASVWFPEARLTLRASKRRGATLSVTNEDTGETILAVA